MVKQVTVRQFGMCHGRGSRKLHKLTEEEGGSRDEAPLIVWDAQDFSAQVTLGAGEEGRMLGGPSRAWVGEVRNETAAGSDGKAWWGER